MNKRTLLFLALTSITVSGCGTTGGTTGITGTSTNSNGVAPLPYIVFSGQGANRSVQTQQLCQLYLRYGFVTPGSTNCSDNWNTRQLTSGQVSSPVFIAQRNAIQGEILAQATTACNAFKNSLTAGSGANSGRWSTIAQGLAIFFSAGATAVSDTQDVKSLTAMAAALTGLSQLIEPSNEKTLEEIIADIELAQQRVESRILLARQGDLSQYSVTDAVDDALKYHAACRRL